MKQGELLSTEEAARRLGVKPSTLIAAHSRHGHYFGIKPVKLPSRLLRWPAAAIESLLTGEGASCSK